MIIIFLILIRFKKKASKKVTTSVWTLCPTSLSHCKHLCVNTSSSRILTQVLTSIYIQEYTWNDYIVKDTYTSSYLYIHPGMYMEWLYCQDYYIVKDTYTCSYLCIHPGMYMEWLYCQGYLHKFLPLYISRNIHGMTILSRILTHVLTSIYIQECTWNGYIVKITILSRILTHVLTSIYIQEYTWNNYIVKITIVKDTYTYSYLYIHPGIYLEWLYCQGYLCKFFPLYTSRNVHGTAWKSRGRWPPCSWIWRPIFFLPQISPHILPQLQILPQTTTTIPTLPPPPPPPTHTHTNTNLSVHKRNTGKCFMGRAKILTGM